MLHIFIFSCFLMCLPNSFAKNECPTYYHCNNTHVGDDDKVAAYCKESHEGTLIDRCCISNNTIVGLDLRFCEIKRLNISQANFSDVEILDLRHNDFEKITSEDFIGLLKLNYLYLSLHIPCPGGKAAWNFTSVDNSTIFCSHQLDYCTTINVTCGDPENAKCQHLGPGTARCTCSSGYFGYKCLNQGEFPTTIFATSVIFPTIVLSIVLWFVQGRDPYRKMYIEE